MFDTRTSGSWLRLAGALSACAFGCEAQASEGYWGEPLLELHGSAIITEETGGETVTPALCFQKGGPMLLPDSVELLPAELRETLAGAIDFGEKLNAVSDRAAIWLGSQITEIVEVESIGRFPAEFNVRAYLPPSDDFVQPLFSGEPAVATGFLCAVRDGHPDIVHMPASIQGTACENEQEGPCVMHFALLSHDEDAYFVETFHCPASSSPTAECERTTQGDIAVRRNLQGSFIEGRAQPVVIYLAEPAKPGSYTAWKYGAPGGLSAGFHLFQFPPPNLSVEAVGNLSDSCRSAYGDALQQVRDEHPDRIRPVIYAGLQIDNIHVDPILRDAFERRYAELSMEHCAMPTPDHVSQVEALKVRFSNPPPSRLTGDFPDGFPNPPQADAL
jgi:hypothetical protein